MLVAALGAHRNAPSLPDVGFACNRPLGYTGSRTPRKAPGMTAQLNDDDDRVSTGDWPLRPVLLAVLGAAAALAIQQLLDHKVGQPPVDRLAIATAIATASIGFGFVAERLRLGWAAAFSIVIGAVAGLIVYWQGVPGGSPDFLSWRLASLFLAIVIAAPLFQTIRDQGRWHLPYAPLHSHAWTNIVLWFAAWAFVAVAWVMCWLLAALFKLIKIDFLEKMLGTDWFVALLLGGAFGAAVGLFRERDRILRLLQAVVTSVLSVLAPVLGAGLLLFLAALPFAGLDALWEATRATTPILLTCVVGELILANAVIGTGDGDTAGNPVLRYGAMALAFAMLPLAVIAAVATGLRIGQHGFTPDRLWALTFIVFATAFGLAYALAIRRGPTNWAVDARAANVRLAIAIAAFALFLATPILSFTAISTADQVARLTSGRVSADKFDWRALAFDFGEPGKAALKQLAASANPRIAAKAAAVAKAGNRYDVQEMVEQDRALAGIVDRLRILPKTVPVPPELLKTLPGFAACGREIGAKCTLIYTPGATEAWAIQSACFDQVPQASGTPPMVTAPNCQIGRIVLSNGEWKTMEQNLAPPMALAERERLAAAFGRGQIDIRTVPRRQLFVGGVPVGEAFE